MAPNRTAKPHRHDEIEITVLEAGWIDYLFGGRPIRNQAGELCLRWAAIPHRYRAVAATAQVT